MDSFFDVFTEISVDGGVNWIPGDGPMRMTLNNPEPSTVGLVLSGLALACLGKFRRRNYPQA